MESEIPEPDVELNELLVLFAQVMHRADMFKTHQVMRETLSTRERMGQILENLQEGGFIPFIQLFKVEEGRLGVVVTFFGPNGADKRIIGRNCAK